MENKQKNQVTNFLMVAGVIFILIAGGIFVKQAWEYLPEIVKKFCLLFVGVGSLVASVKASHNEKLKKTEHALFYIGDCFIGFFTLSVLNGFTTGDARVFNDFITTAFTLFSMAVPMLMRLITEQRLVDFITTVIFSELIAIFGMAGLETGMADYVLCISLMSVAFFFIWHIMDSRDTDDTMISASKVTYLTHMIYSTVWVSFLSGGLSVMEEPAVLTCWFAVAAIGICIVLSNLWHKNENADFRVIHIIMTILLFLSVLTYNLMDGTLTDALILGIVSLVVAIVSAIGNNMPYVIISVVTLLLIGFYITMDFWLSIAWWVYLFVAGVIMVLVAIKREREG